jgi:hypothetical protein
MMHMNTPPKNIRVTVPVSPLVLAKFQRLSEVTNVSVGRAMGEWLSDTHEGVDFFIETMESAKRAPQEAVRTLQNYAVTLQAMTTDIVDKAKAIKVPPGFAGDASAPRQSPAAASAPVDPPSCNTGGKVPQNKQKPRGKPL